MSEQLFKENNPSTKASELMQELPKLKGRLYALMVMQLIEPRWRLLRRNSGGDSTSPRLFQGACCVRLYWPDGAVCRRNLPLFAAHGVSGGGARHYGFFKHGRPMPRASRDEWRYRIN